MIISGTAATDVSREVIIHAPQGASCQYAQCSQGNAPAPVRIPAQEDARGGHGGDGPPDPRPHGFSEYQGGKQSGGHTFKVEEERRSGRGSALQAEHQHDGRYHASGQDGSHEPWQVSSSQRGLRLRLSGQPLGSFEEHNAQAGPQVKQGGHGDGVDLAEQYLRQWSAGAEQGGSGQGLYHGIGVGALHACEIQLRHDALLLSAFL